MLKLSRRTLSIFIFLISLNVYAVTVLDQSYDVQTWGGGASSAAVYTNQSVGQSFTIGQDGILSQIDFNIWHTSGNNQIQVSLLTLDDSGAPAYGSPLFTSVFSDIASGYSNADYYSFDLSSLNLSVTAGQQYAFYLSSIGDGWFATRGGNHYEDGLTFNGPGYLGGTAWLNSNPWANSYQDRNYSIDLNFRSFIDTVSVPESSTLSLMGLIFILFGLVKVFPTRSNSIHI